MSIETERVSIEVGGQAMPAYLARPAGAGTHPAVIVLEEIFGVNAHIRDVTDRVAREGYVAVAPDVHHRAEAGLELEYDDAGRKKGMSLIPKLTTAGFQADLQATLAFLRARKDVRGDRIGAMGFCIGGHLAYLAATFGELRATAAFYGGGIATFGPGGATPTVGRTGTIKGKIICFFGGQDQSITAEQVATIRKALVDHHIRHEVHVYPQAGHGFFRDPTPAYNPEAAADAWRRVKQLFAEELTA